LWRRKASQAARTVIIPKKHILQALARIACSIQATENAPEVASSSDSDLF
jgi:hypothetical protein